MAADKPVCRCLHRKGPECTWPDCMGEHASVVGSLWEPCLAVTEAPVKPTFEFVTPLEALEPQQFLFDAPWPVDGTLEVEQAAFNKLILGCTGIVIDLATGEVTIPPELELSDAARAFWDAVQRMTGQRCGFD